MDEIVDLEGGLEEYEEGSEEDEEALEEYKEGSEKDKGLDDAILEEDGLEEDVEGANDRLAGSLRQKFKALPRDSSDRCTIFRVPENIRKGKPDLFTPAVVSIGPYHRGDPNLRVMEERKRSILRDFIRRTRKGITLKVCIEGIRELESKARRCYSETIDMDSDSFVEMMLLDSSFILLRLYKTTPEIYARFVDAGWSADMISHDLIMIENQIPFFILQRMYNYLFGQNMTSRNMKWLSTFFANGCVSTNIPPSPSPEEIHHLLHLCHYYIVPPNQELHKTNEPTFPTSDPSWSIWTLPCATELQEAGIKIRKKKVPCDFTDVSFKFQSGILEIPFLHIADRTPIILMNLVAIEQCKSLKLPRIISTYCFFMDAIVNTANDVMILQHRSIIDNMLSGEEEVAAFFNQSGQGVIIYNNHYLAGLFQEINKYCRGSKKHRYRAKLMRDYFSNPWSMFSLGAAIFLLLLTFTQTFYTVFAYHRPPN